MMGRHASPPILRAVSLAAAAVLAGCATTEPPAPALAPAPEPAPAWPARDAPPTVLAMPGPATAPPQPAPTGEADAAAPGPPEQFALSLAQIEKGFAYHRRHFHALYQAWRGQRPQLAGRMLVDFMINPDGTTRDAQLVHSSLGEPGFEQAVLEQLALMAFPPARATTPVRAYPISFGAQP